MQDINHKYNTYHRLNLVTVEMKAKAFLKTQIVFVMRNEHLNCNVLMM